MRITPDGNRYLAMARGEPQPMPFHLRWYLPYVCRESAWGWVAANVLGIVGLLSGTFALGLTHGLSEAECFLAVVLVAGLPALRFAWHAPVLVDMPGLACAVWAAVFWGEGWATASALFVVLGAMIWERTPLWAAVFAWEPLLLAGLVVPLLRWALVRHAPADHELLEKPWRCARSQPWRSPVLILPWGACVFALVGDGVSAALLTALAVGYAQLAVATDRTRLFQQAAPVVAIAAAAAVPETWFLPVAVAHWFNPWAGDGL